MLKETVDRSQETVGREEVRRCGSARRQQVKKTVAGCGEESLTTDFH